MSEQKAKTSTRRLREAAEDYREHGYEVWLHPDGSVLPGLPTNLKPDLVARRGSETVIVEVKSGEAIESEGTLSELAKYAEELPGARLELIAVGRSGLRPPVGEDHDLTKSLATRRIDLISTLIDEGDTSAGIVLGWMTAESILRSWLTREKIRVRSGVGPAGLAKTAYSYGLISDEQMEFLLELAESRNVAVHGRAATPVASMTSRLQSLVATWDQSGTDPA
jgi:hypothetical protein